MSRHVPATVISIVEESRLSSTHAYGVTSTQMPRAAREDTVFEAASMGKAVAAYVTMRLVAQGVVDLDEPLAKHLPRTYVDDPRIDLVTARLALTHRSGLRRDGGSGAPYFEKAPGIDFKYSNEGIAYLQAALESVTGESFETLTQRFVCEPLGLEDTSFIWRDAYDQQAARPHDGGGAPMEKWRPQTAKAASSLHTTGPDFAKFLCAVIDPAASANGLSPDHVADMLRPHVEVREVWGAGPPDPGSWWGLGWGVQTPEPASIWHWGWNDGFLSFAVGWPQARRGIVAFTNGMNGLWICKDVVTWFAGTVHPSFRWLEH